MVFGTFDILHKGHLDFFRQARRLAKNPYLTVSVARDVNVKRIKSRLPRNNEEARLRAVKKVRLVDKAVLGGLRSYLPHILQERPHIIALGYDQKAYVAGLRKQLLTRGLRITVRRLKSYHPRVYKSSKIAGRTEKRI